VRETPESDHLRRLKDHIDLTEIPFSDRGSRLLVYREPDRSQLVLRLAERLTPREAGVDAYRDQPPFAPDIHVVDAAGERLDFTPVVYPHAVHFRTRLGEFRLAFQDADTLAFGLPDGPPAGLYLRVMPAFAAASQSGGSIHGTHDLTYAAHGPMLRSQATPAGADGSGGDRNGYAIECVLDGGTDRAISLRVGGYRSAAQPPVPVPFSAAYAAAANRWHAWFEQAPRADDRYEPTYTQAWWVMAYNLVAPRGHLLHEGLMPSKSRYVGLWLWDSALHAIGLRHADVALARNQLRAMLAWQEPDGMLPDAIYDDGVVTYIDHPFPAEVTKPPILAWAAMKLHATEPDLEFLAEIYPSLVRWNAWWFTLRDDDMDGLCQYNHPYSSGLDDSPLWDYGMPVVAPDLNTYLCLQMSALADMAGALGLDDEARTWRQHADTTARRMVDRLWDPAAGLFRAVVQADGEPVPVVTPFNLLPLWTGRLPEDILHRVIQRLTDTDAFWQASIGDAPMLPTVARNDPQFDPAAMWRGPVWANVNYFFIDALRRVGAHDLASYLRDQTLALVADHGIYEYYNAETGVAPATAARTFGWTAATYIELAMSKE
jgi:putative isomerase